MCGPLHSPGDTKHRSRRGCASSGSLKLLDELLGRMHAPLVRVPTDNLEDPLLGLGDGRAAFNPVAGVDVDHVADLTHGRVMDVTADHALRAVAAGLLRQSRFKLTDIVHRAFDLVLQIGRQGPIGHAEPAAHHVEMHVEPERHRVAPVPEEGEPLGVADDHVELVAMHDEIAPAVRADVNRLALDGDAAELRAAIIPVSYTHLTLPT